MIKKYENLDVLLTKNADEFEARIISSPAGQAHCRFAIPDDTDSLGQCITQFTRSSRTFELHDAITTENESCSKSSIKNIGGSLFRAIFKDEMMECLTKSLLQTRNNGLRIRLQFSNDVPELAALPWEYLYDENEERFLTLSVKTPIIRYPELISTHQPTKITPPLNILVIISSPEEFPQLDVETEWNNLKKALKTLEERGLVAITRLPMATVESLQHELQRRQYHILHYIGHSDFEPKTGNAVLLFENKRGKAKALEAEALGKLLRDVESMRLVILNSCEGGKASSKVFFSGVALSLIKKNIPAVIAMQFEITDAAAITFSNGFYNALANGYPIEAALTEARKSIDIGLNHIEWGTPTLYMRSSDGQLFSMAKKINTLFGRKTGTGTGRSTKDKNSNKLELQKTIIGAVFILLMVALVVYAFKVSDSPSPPMTTSPKEVVITSKLASGLIVAGFNCAKARTVTEKAICSSATTATADRNLNEIYAATVLKLPPPLVLTLADEQDNWLRRRDQYIEINCISAAGDVKASCIVNYYNKRSRLLLRKGNTLNPNDFINVLVIDPPSNVRDKPSGNVVCQVRSKKRIIIYKNPEIGENNANWYWTKVCGKWAVIHDSQFGR